MGEDPISSPAGGRWTAQPDGGGGDRDAWESSPSVTSSARHLPLAGEERGGVRRAIAAAAARFGFSATPRLDAELLMAHALGVTREALLLGRMDDPAPPAFAALADRRAAQEPVAYLTGSRAFWTIELRVGPGVLVPRADSETLIEAAVDHFRGRAPARVLDLGTGPGTLLLAALAQWPGARGLGVDASEEALGYARANAAALGMADRARFRRGDWARGVAEAFDLVLCNPPYVADGEPLPREVAGFEPAGALYAGPDGLAEYRRLAPDLPRLIAPGGVACVEIGHDQAESAAALLRAQGLTVAGPGPGPGAGAGAVRRDLGGRERCLVVTP